MIGVCCGFALSTHRFMYDFAHRPNLPKSNLDLGKFVDASSTGYMVISQDKNWGFPTAVLARIDDSRLVFRVFH